MQRSSGNSRLEVACAAWVLAAGMVVRGVGGEANYQPYVVGERAAGMGGAVVATADGMDASFYNPAGLGRETRDSISVNGTLYGIQKFETKDAAFPGEEFGISSFATIPTGLSAVRKLKEGTVASFSVFVPSHSSAREIQAFPQNRHYYNYSQDEQTLLAGPSIGHVVNERLSIGASVHGVYQTASEFQNLYWGDYSYTLTENYKYTVMGVVGTVGIQCRLGSDWLAGMAISTPSWNVTGDGRVQFSEVQGDAVVAGADSQYYENLDADNGLPAHVRMGIGWQRPGVGSFEVDVTHHFARNYKWMDGVSDGESITVRQEREAVTDMQAGVEYIFRRRYPLRAGCFTSFSSSPDLDPDDISTPSQIDLYGVTASAGVEGENVVLNFGLSYVWGDGDAFGTRLDEQEFLVTGITGTRERSLYAFACTSYRF